MLGFRLLMSETLFKILGAALFCVFIMMILKRENAESALSLRMVAGVGLAIACVGAINPILSYIREIGESLGADAGVADAVGILLKALGVSLLTHICATVCRDSGEGSVAQYVELAGKIEIILLSLPLVGEILDLALGLIEAG